MPAATWPASAAGRDARPERGGWLLSGQKTWASRGAFAEWCFGLFRTDPDAERHRGLTYFLIELTSPGVTVRPIPQIDGETGFAEIFFEDVFVPDDQVLGERGPGLERGHGHGRLGTGAEPSQPGPLHRGSRSPGRPLHRALDKPIPSMRPGVADDVAQAWMDAEAYRLNTLWTATRVLEGGSVGPEASANKIHWSETDLAIHRAALALLGPEAELHGPSTSNPWLDGFLFALAGPIYAGTNEIQRNVVAERMLGLPRG